MKQFFYLLISITALVSCTLQTPVDFSLAEGNIEIFPDYTNITVPYNIVPMNFRINEEADNYITKISSTNEEDIIIKGKEVSIPLKRWTKLLRTNKGENLAYDVYVKQHGKWKKYNFNNTIANEPIDEYISYRLIEPSYKLYKKISINQRNLTNFNEDKIYSSPVKWQCVNCHAYQDYNRKGNMHLHLRGNDGGTIITYDGTVEKINLKTEELKKGGAYVSWHPIEKLIAYSMNDIGQSFHTKDNQKVEVQDTHSDLILYDVDKNEIRYIIESKDSLETFPSWAPDGKTLYYVSATLSPELSKAFRKSRDGYKEIKYSIYKMSFNPETKRFGEPEIVFDAAARGKSATFPKISPDGKYLMFTMAEYGNFHIWHKSANLYTINIETNELDSMAIVNSPDVESYHSWSSNGRWFIFSSRRIDGSYTRFYISYFDKNGMAQKPFILPQKYSEFYKQFLKSYNLPEFMVAPVNYSYRDFAIDGSGKRAIFSDGE